MSQQAPNPRRMRELLGRRLRWLTLAPVVVVTILVLKLWHIQMVQGPELRRQAAENRFASREMEADRGVIYDRAGYQVVLNRPQFAARIVPAALPKDAAARDAVLERVAELLVEQGGSLEVILEPPDGATPEPGSAPTAAAAGAASVRAAAVAARKASIWRLLLDEGGEFVPTWSALTVARNVDRQAAFALMEDEVALPGVLIGESSVREYPAGPSLAHLLGFTGAIPREAVEDYVRRGYERYDPVGRTGIEHAFEEDLAGTKGEKIVMVDASGQEIEELEVRRRAVPGHSLHLTIDLALQRAAEAALQAGLQRVGATSGAVVAIDPRDGAVRAMVSLPTFDNNLFSTGASPQEYEALIGDPLRPMLNRAISGLYPPGSTFKVITASAGLQTGVIDAARRLVCPGMISIVNQYDPGVSYPYVCWILGQGAHGAVNVVQAIAQSCDVFFYEVAGGQATGRPEVEGLGSERLAEYARAFGLGAKSGIDLLGEAEGLVPSASWHEATFGEPWTTGQTYIMGIGQSFARVTPLQMANVAAAIANGGALWRPRVVDRVTDADGNTLPGQPEGAAVHKIRDLPVDPAYIDLVRQGMRAAVTSGSAQAAWSRLPTEVAVAGKTGTAEFCDGFRISDGGTPEDQTDDSWDCRRTKDGYLLTHAWFISFAPYDNPEIALAVMVDGSGLSKVIQGSEVAAPIAADILRAYFRLPPPPARDAQPAAPPAHTEPAVATPSPGAAP